MAGRSPVVVIVQTMDDDEHSAAELKRHQEARERAERQEAAQSSDETEAAAHLRRADKAAYLSEKLAAQEQADADDEKA